MPGKHYDLDQDTTLTNNSDEFIPSQKAVKTYVDNKDNNSVHKSGNETIAGNKTFSSTVAADISGNAATATNATNDGSGNQITTTYATKAELNDIEYVLQIKEW